MRAKSHAFIKSFKRWFAFDEIELNNDELDPNHYDLPAINDRFFKALHRTSRTRIDAAKVFGLDPNIPMAMQPKENLPRPTMQSMIISANFLGVSVRWLLYGEAENDVDLYVESNAPKSHYSFSANNSSVVQGNERSTIIVNNNSMNDHELEVMKMFRSMNVYNQVKLLSYAYELLGSENNEKPERRCDLSS